MGSFLPYDVGLPRVRSTAREGSVWEEGRLTTEVQK